MPSRPKPKGGSQGSGHAASVQAQLELNDIPEFANEPGPGHYFGPESEGFSALGQQKFSKCPSAPQIGFAKTGWDQWNGILISKNHNKTYVGKDSPGAVYELGGALNSKGTVVGKGLRPSMDRALGVDPHGSPGPVYNLRDGKVATIGQYLITETEKCRADKSFGKGERFKGSGLKGGIGPGEYARKDFALRADSGKSIGTGRASWEKVCTPGWEIEGRCRASPGPGPPLWEKKGQEGGSMGRAERFPRKADATCSPGPAKYDQDAVSMSRQGNQVLSDTRTPAQAHFGLQPKKPRFRPALAMNTGKHGGWGYF